MPSVVYATRKYYPSPDKAAPKDDIDFSSVWDDATNGVRLGMTWDNPSLSGFTSYTFGNNLFVLRSPGYQYRVLFYQFVSDALASSIHIDAGSLLHSKAPFFRAVRTTPVNPLTLYPLVYRAAQFRVIQPDGTVRYEFAVTPLNGALNRYHLQGLQFIFGAAGTVGWAYAGDYLVVEVGIQAYADTVPHQGAYAAEIEVGDSSDTDLHAGDNDQDNSWGQFAWVGGTPISTVKISSHFSKALTPTRSALRQQYPAVSPQGDVLNDFTLNEE